MSSSVYSGDQRSLDFGHATSRVEREFHEWLHTAEGALILAEAAERALRLKARGFRHYGIAALWEAMRYDRDVVAGPDGAGLKLNNNHRAALAREIMRRETRLEGFFETRTLRGREDWGRS